jgi:ABC-type sugar transport system permease subunit
MIGYAVRHPLPPFVVLMLATAGCFGFGVWRLATELGKPSTSPVLIVPVVIVAVVSGLVFSSMFRTAGRAWSVASQGVLAVLACFAALPRRSGQAFPQPAWMQVAGASFWVTFAVVMVVNRIRNRGWQSFWGRTAEDGASRRGQRRPSSWRSGR